MKNRSLGERIAENWPAKILCVAVAVVLFIFYRIGSLEERFFSVPLDVRVSEGFVPVETSARSVRVNIRGASDEIFLILEEDIVAYVDVSDHNAAGRYRKVVRLEKLGSAENADVEIQVEPRDALITIEEKISRNLRVAPSIVGFPERGYELAEYFVTPSVMEVVGPESHVSSLDELETENIDLTGRSEDFTIRARVLYEPAMVEITGSDIVEFRGIIVPQIVSRTYEAVAVAPINIAASLRVSTPPGIGSVRVRGPQLLIEQVDSDDVALIVDCSQVDTPGSYVLDLSVDVPNGLSVVSSAPQTIELEFQRVAEEGQ